MLYNGNVANTGLNWTCLYLVTIQHESTIQQYKHTEYPNKYAHGFVVFCFVVVMQSFIMNSHEVFIHTHQGCFAGTGAIVRLPQCQWSKPDGYRKISQYITTTKHSKAKSVYIFLGIYCRIHYTLRIVCSTMACDWNIIPVSHVLHNHLSELPDSPVHAGLHLDYLILMRLHGIVIPGHGFLLSFMFPNTLHGAC